MRKRKRRGFRRKPYQIPNAWYSLTSTESDFVVNTLSHMNSVGSDTNSHQSTHNPFRARVLSNKNPLSNAEPAVVWFHRCHPTAFCGFGDNCPAFSACSEMQEKRKRTQTEAESPQMVKDQAVVAGARGASRKRAIHNHSCHKIDNLVEILKPKYLTGNPPRPGLYPNP